MTVEELESLAVAKEELKQVSIEAKRAEFLAKRVEGLDTEVL